MKLNKLFAGVLAAAMMMSVGVSAMAATTTWTDQKTVTLTKNYTLTNAGTTSPEETFTFSTLTCTEIKNAGVGVTTANAPVPTIGSATFATGAAGDANKGTQNITITLPTYTAVGIYTYTFEENDGNTAGVSYRSDDFRLVVSVIEQDGKVRVAYVHTEAEGAQQKSNTFDNTYSAGSLSVKKEVTGEFGDEYKEFTVKVTFTAPEGDTVKSDISYVDGTETKKIEAGEGWTGSKEAEITLKKDETVTFTNIPYGVTYTVVENDYTGDNGGYDAPKYDSNQNGTINAASVSTTIINNKGGDIDTGVILDNAPYIVMLAVVAGGAFFMISKKRREE